MDRAKESNVIFLKAWDEMNRECAGFETLRGGLIETSWSGQPVMFFNLALTMVTPGGEAEFREAVRGVTAWAAERPVPWMLAVCHETMGGLAWDSARILDEEGFVAMMPLTGMDAAELTTDVRGRATGSWLTEADEGVGRRVMRVNEAAYGMPLGEPGSLAPEWAGWWGAPERMTSLLEVEGKAVSCAAVLHAHGLRYVALVATDPGARGKGYATMAMRDVLERSRQAGLGERTYLHATEAGRPVYEKMGYAETARYTVYLRKEFVPAEH